MAGVKITDLEVLLEAASDDLLYIVDVSDNTQSPEGTSKAIEVSKVGRTYKSYVAYVYQFGGGNVTAQIIENTLGFTPTWARTGTGQFSSNNAEWLTPIINNKIVAFINPTTAYTEYNIYRISINNSDTSIKLLSGNYDINTDSFTGIDNIFSDNDNYFKTIIEIRIYN